MKRRGVSPIVSTVLITAIIVVLGTTIFLWAVTMLGLSSQSISILTSAASERLMEDFVIEYVKFYYDNNSIAVYVRNVGQIHITIVSIYIQDINNTENFARISVNVLIPVGNLTKIPASVPFTLERGHIYMVKVASSRGNSYSAEVEAI